jgi:hypothetical protein
MLPQLEGKIVIEDHPARHEVCGILVPQHPEHRQVLINGRRVAYCGAKPNMPLCFIVLLPQDYIDSVREQVEKTIGPVSKVAEVPSVDQHGNREERLPPGEAVASAEDGEEEDHAGAYSGHV